ADIHFLRKPKLLRPRDLQQLARIILQRNKLVRADGRRPADTARHELDDAITLHRVGKIGVLEHLDSPPRIVALVDNIAGHEIIQQGHVELAFAKPGTQAKVAHHRRQPGNTQLAVDPVPTLPYAAIRP